MELFVYIDVKINSTLYFFFSSLYTYYQKMDSVDSKFPKYMVYCVMIACLEPFSQGYLSGATNVPGTITHECPNGMDHVASGGLPDCLPMNTALW